MGPFRVLQISIMVLMLFGSTLVVRVVGLTAAPSGSSSTWLAGTEALAGPLLQGDNGDNSADNGDAENSDADNGDSADNSDSDNNDGGDNSDNSSDDNDNSSDDNDNFDDSPFELPPPIPTRAPEPACANPGQETAFTSYDEKVTVRVFPNTPQPVKVEILQIIDFLSAPLPPGNLVGLLAYEIRANSCGGGTLTQLPAEMNLAIRYNDLEATGLDESRFVIGRLDLATATWRPIEKRANDPASNVTTATISEPGYYMVWEMR
jgi:hypothetical protein